MALLKLHLGCGKRLIPGFVHVDLDQHPHVDHQSSIERLPMFEADSAELIYCCHAFEYFDRDQAPLVLAEWRRVLAPGGVLRLAVPDFEALVGLYIKNGEIRQVLGPIFGSWKINTTSGADHIYHRIAYDFQSLSRTLTEAGFSGVRRWDWRETEHRDVDDFSQAYHPHLDKQNGTLISLNVEASK